MGLHPKNLVLLSVLAAVWVVLHAFFSMGRSEWGWPVALLGAAVILQGIYIIRR